MEIRNSKIMVSKAGGTAGKTSVTYKVSIPSKWVSELDLIDFRDVDLLFDGDKIVISKSLSPIEFFKRAVDFGHDVHVYKYMNNDVLCTTIYADFTTKSLKVSNHTSSFIHTAFGNNDSPTWNDLMDFFEERCIPRTRANINDCLKALGLYSYNPIEIIKVTQGRMAEDNQWIYEEKISV